jgi:hypothetical protein
MSDSINRQAAIRWVKTECNPYGKPTLDFESGKKVIEHLEQMPSAEPKIIYCGDCKYKDDGIDEDGIPFLKCLNGRSYGGTRINDFCSWAERRTDE